MTKDATTPFSAPRVADLSQKARGTLRNLWPGLTNASRFKKPRTIAEDRTFNPFRDPNLEWRDSRGAHSNWYFGTEQLDPLTRVETLILDLPAFRGLVAGSTVHPALMNAIKFSIRLRAGTGSARPPDIELDELLAAVASTIHDVTFYFLLDGVTLPEVDPIQLGDAMLCTFTTDHRDELLGTHPNADMQRFFEERFLRQICIVVTACGDRDRSRENAERHAHGVVDVLRLATCLLAPTHILNHAFRIHLRADAYLSRDHVVTRDHTTGGVSVSFERGSGRLETLDLTQRLLHELQRDSFLDTAISVMETVAPTDLTAVLRAAIAWVGEAEHENEPPTALLKYWIALEALLTDTRESVAAHLARAITATLVCGGYATESEANALYSRMQSLYDIRSRVAHQGLLSVTHRDLVESCETAGRCILAVLFWYRQGHDRNWLRSHINTCATRLGMPAAS